MFCAEQWDVFQTMTHRVRCLQTSGPKCFEAGTKRITMVLCFVTTRALQRCAISPCVFSQALASGSQGDGKHPGGVVGAVLGPRRRRRRYGARHRLRRGRVRRQHGVGAAAAAAHAARLAPLTLLLAVPRVDQQMERRLRPVPRPPPVAAALVHLRGSASPDDQAGGITMHSRID